MGLFELAAGLFPLIAMTQGVDIHEDFELLLEKDFEYDAQYLSRESEIQSIELHCVIL